MSVLHYGPARRWFLCCLIVIGASPDLHGTDDPTHSYFEGLRQRHLFGIAEGYCLSRLAEPRLSDTDRARTTLELSRTLAAHAMVAEGNEQSELWNRAQNTLSQIIKDHPNWADAPVFNAEHARIAAQKAEIFYWQSKAIPFNETLKKSAMSKLAQAIPELTQAEVQLQRLLKKAGSYQNFTVLNTATIRDTLLDFQLLIAQTKIKLADLYDEQSPQRKMQLQAASKYLEPLSRRASTLQVTWMSKLALIQCDRINGDFSAAVRAIKALIKEHPPAYLNEPIFVESIRVLLAENKAQLAATQIIKFRQDQGHYSSELGYLEVNALIRLRKIAMEKKQQSLAEEIWQQIETRSQQLWKAQPGYWAQRTRMLVNQQNQIDQYGSEISQNLKQAQLLYSQGKVEQAIAAYERVATQAAEQGNADLAFELGFTSASLQLRAKQFQQAAAQFQSLSLRYEAAPKAADAGLLAAWCLGQLYTQSRTKSRRLAYTTALERVRNQFPNSDSFYEAGWMLARLEESRLQYSKALVLYSEIPDEHAKAADAHLGIARCYENILLRLTSLKKPTKAWRQEAIEVLEQFLADFPDQTDNAKGQSQAEIALRLTRIYLNDTPPLYAKANRLLELIVHMTKAVVAKLKRNSERSESSISQMVQEIKKWNDLSNQALRLQIIALAGQGKPSAAQSLVESLETAGTDELLSVLNGISQINLDLTPEVRRELGMLQLKSAEKLASRRDSLKPQQANRLDLCLAEAYLAIDQPIRALEYYQTLLKHSPKDASLIRQVALLLERCGTKQCLQQASQKWQSLITAEKPGTLPWLDIRLHLIQTWFGSGNEAEAKKLLGVTRLLYPDLGNPDMKSRYDEMQSRLKK
ncbi:MAG: tetratricopeptide repeat protein [Gimesia sp.]|nr:tetratricopeptide repeat protein [Gimesia sp.]